MTGFLLYMVPIVELTAILPRSNPDAWRHLFVEALAAGAAW